MRLILPVVMASIAAGCATSRWQIAVPTGSSPILLDTATGKTWVEDSYQRSAEDNYIPYWKEMSVGVATTRPSGG
jgi:hypothetical protein